VDTHSPKDIKKVVEAMEQKTQKRVSTKTIKRFIKKSHIWKRIKKVPAQSPEPHKYSRSQAMIARLHTRESHGECALWYFDGTGLTFPLCGFDQISCWFPKRTA
jgi:hypothetical protein